MASIRRVRLRSLIRCAWSRVRSTQTVEFARIGEFAPTAPSVRGSRSEPRRNADRSGWQAMRSRVQPVKTHSTEQRMQRVRASFEWTSEQATHARFVRCRGDVAESRHDPAHRRRSPIPSGTARNNSDGCQRTTRQLRQPGTQDTTCVGSAGERIELKSERNERGAGLQGNPCAAGQ